MKVQGELIYVYERTNIATSFAPGTKIIYYEEKGVGNQTTV